MLVVQVSRLIGAANDDGFLHTESVVTVMQTFYQPIAVHPENIREILDT